MAVMPQPAASLLIFRGQADARQVLMGKRPPDARFMPNSWVFPGGRVETEDYISVSDHAPNSPTQHHLKEHAHALCTAAIRETREETGLYICTNDGSPALAQLDYLARATTPQFSTIRFDTRFFIVDASHAQGELRSNGELLDLSWINIALPPKPIAGVTLFMIEEATRWLNSEPKPKVRSVYC